MIEDGLISQKEGGEILKKYIEFGCDLDKLASLYKIKKHSKKQLLNFIIESLKNMILEFEKELFIFKKITSLKFYHRASTKTYEHLIHFNKYLSKELSGDLLFEYQSKFNKIEKTTIKNKYELYLALENYANSQQLLEEVYHKIDHSHITKRAYELPEQIFSSHDLEVIYILYETFKGDTDQIEKRLEKINPNNVRMKGKLLEESIKNLENIGMFRCYLKSVMIKGGKGCNWEKFMIDFEHEINLKEKWDPNLKVILVRIAVRDDVQTYQIREICLKIDRRYNDKPTLAIKEKPNLKDNEIENKSPEIQKLRNELSQILMNKISYK